MDYNTFKTIKLELTNPVKVASLLGALIAYGTGKKFAEQGLIDIGIGEFYNGNVRKEARRMAVKIAEAANVETPNFQAYYDSNTTLASVAGEAVRGTEFDLGTDPPPTTYETDGEVAEEVVAL